MSAAARVSIVQRRDAEAYALALAAVRELRYDRTAIETYAAAASVVGQCGEAVRAQRHALTLLWEGERGASRMEERLKEYEQCAAQEQASAP